MPNKDSSFEERNPIGEEKADEVACKEWYRSKKCIIEKYGFDLLDRRELGKFFHNIPQFFASTPDFIASTSDYKLTMLVESKAIDYNGICNGMKVTHWEAYEKWFKLTEQEADFNFFFYNKNVGRYNAPFEAVKEIIDNDSEIDYLDKGKWNEKKIHRFSVRGLEEYNVKRW
tara:strand:+ start:2465 stop:2980 length:516 start_codon:yes stop_codon:yes gene_type:complete